jgi:hypothetical protein
MALLDDLPEAGLARAQVGTVVERLDQGTVLVAFSDNESVPYAITPSPTPASSPSASNSSA